MPLGKQCRDSPLCVMPTRGSQLFKKVSRALSHLWLIKAFRPGKHNMRKVEFSIHAICIAQAGEAGETIEALRRSPDKLGFGFL